MILKPQLEDLTIGYYLGKITIGVGLTMLIPFIAGLVFFKEINPAFDFLISLEIALTCGLLLSRICKTGKDLNWLQGMVVVSLSWLVAMLIGAMPLYLSGHYKSFLDACFESMSGFTTSGLTLVQNLDHLSFSHNLWRHLTHFIGGQGIAIIALALFMKGSAGGFKMYVGEARDERILPNVIHTARFIWFISIVYLILGTVALGVVGINIGLKPQNAFFHGVCIFMAGFDTAGFTPNSQNILYYHSSIFEIIAIAFMILGSVNFNLHYQFWKGNRKELWKNIETRTFFLSIMVIFLIVAVGLNKLSVYSGPLALFRKGFFQLISGHTGTGYMTIYAQQFIREWGDLALVALICAMGLGGSVCSTAGGIKMLRLGVIFKALRQDIKAISIPESAILTQKFHHIKTVFLEDKQVRTALLITASYVVLYILGAFIGMWCGYPFLDSLFESTSAAGNVGFSCGITGADMPVVLKITYIIQMWAGRLEFMAVFALFGFAVAMFRGK